jgi:hypothetical protein
VLICYLGANMPKTQEEIANERGGIIAFAQALS